MAVPIPVLQEFQLLQAFTLEQLRELASHAQERTFAKREVVLQRDSNSQFLCFLVEGRLQGVDFTLDGKEVGLYFVDPMDYFGELSVIDGQEQPELIVALTRSRVIFIPRQLIRHHFFSSPTLAEQVATRLAQRLRNSAAQRKILGINNPVQRLSAQLQQLALSSSGQAIAGSTTRCSVIQNAPTHQELAIMMNMSRETVTRTLQVLQARGMLAREGTQLIIIKVDDLRRISEGTLDVSKP